MTEIARQALVNARNNPRYELLHQSTSGLVFFGTPHEGGDKTLVSLGNLATRVAQHMFRQPPSDIIEALKDGSLFADVLQDNWRHQLTRYKIVFFYEDVGDIVPKKSAVFGLPGDLENQVGIDTGHSDMCRFDRNNSKDMDNFDFVQGNIQELYNMAMRRNVSANLSDRVSPSGTAGIAGVSAKPIILIPYSRNPQFVGRDNILKKLDNKIFGSSDNQQKAALCGLGGVGKSQIALVCVQSEATPARIFNILGIRKQSLQI